MTGRRESRAFVIQVIGAKPMFLGPHRVSVDSVQDAYLFFSSESAELHRAFHPGLKVIPVTVTVNVSLEQQ